jgi:N-acetylglutamate synthase/N-acetylornithine aminotransferase
VPGGRRRWGRVTAAVGYTHATVDHAETFVNGNMHVMGVESFWPTVFGPAFPHKILARPND